MKSVRLAALGLLLAVLVVGCQWLRREAGPQAFTVSSFAWLPGNEGLVVAKNVAGEERLWLVGNPDARSQRLTEGAHAESDVAVSQDGRYIAFVGYATEKGRYLALHDRTTKATRRLELPLGGAYPASPMFSPDGRFLALARVFGAADAHSDVFQDIVIYDLVEQRAVLVPSRADTNRLLGFGAVSDRIYMWSTYAEYNHSWNFRYDLWEVELATLAARRLSEGGPVLNASLAHKQPAAPRFVFHAWQAEDINLNIVPVPRNIYIADIDPYRQKELVAGNRASWPRFSPDGGQIVFLKDDLDKGTEVFVMDSDGRNPRRLTQTGLPKTSPQWSPDGRRIAFIQVEGDGRHALYAMQADGRELRRIAP